MSGIHKPSSDWAPVNNARATPSALPQRRSKFTAFSKFSPSRQSSNPPDVRHDFHVSEALCNTHFDSPLRLLSRGFCLGKKRLGNFMFLCLVGKPRGFVTGPPFSVPLNWLSSEMHKPFTSCPTSQAANTSCILQG